MKKVTINILICFLIISCLSQDVESNIESNIESYVESKRVKMKNVVGMATGIVDETGLIWSGYYGTKDLEVPVDIKTMFNIASISKTIMVTAIMQLWEDGKFKLDDDINEYLDFEVINPNYPDEVITYRQLMTHTSSIIDRFPLYGDLYTIHNGGGDYEGELGTFLREYLTKNGKYYSNDNFLKSNPGKEFNYSNYATSILAYLVEVLSGMNYVEYCENNIFKPLEMNSSYFFIDGIPNIEDVAKPYYEQELLPHYSYPDYPSGSLRTTIEDLSKFCSYYLRTETDNSIILKRETIQLILDLNKDDTMKKDSNNGLIWGNFDPYIIKAIGHTGGDPGVSTFMLLFPEEQLAGIILMNGEPSNWDYVEEVMRKLRNKGNELKSHEL